MALESGAMASHDSSSVDPPAKIPEAAASEAVEITTTTPNPTTPNTATTTTTTSTSTRGAQHRTETLQHDSVEFHHDDDYLNGLDVDSNDTDTDSAITDLRNTSSTASVRSSVFDFVEDNGRTYHSYKQGKYFLPNDNTEQGRLDLQHQLWRLMLKNKLYICPVSSPQSVLDLGTGTGIWAIEFATQQPSSDVIGTDLSPIQPPFVPPNCRFEVDDAEDQWTFSHKFDGAKALGRDWRCAEKYKQWFIDAGFEDVVEDRFPAPVGTWPKDKDDKLVGLYWTANMLEGINGMSNVTLRKGLGMSSEDMELLLADVRRDLKDRSIHPFFPMYVVYGRKPLSP